MIDNSVSLYMSCQLNCYPLSDEPSKSEVLASLLENISVKKKGVTITKKRCYYSKKKTLRPDLNNNYISPAY